MKKLCMSLLLFSALTSCSYHDTNERLQFNGLIIRTGTMCGWCAGMDSLTISADHTAYVSNMPCDQPTRTKQLDTQPEKWNELIRSLDWDKFNEVHVNTCAICVDGCDVWITVENDDIYHRIRFTESSPEIAPIKDFIDKVNAYRAQVKFK